MTITIAAITIPAIAPPLRPPKNIHYNTLCNSNATCTVHWYIPDRVSGVSGKGEGMVEVGIVSVMLGNIDVIVGWGGSTEGISVIWNMWYQTQ